MNKTPILSIDEYFRALKKAPRVKGYQRCSCGQGHMHQSRLEARVCNDLELMKKAGVITDCKSQYKIDLRVNGVHICNHFVDFKLTFPDNHEEFWEAKGQESRDWLKNMRLTKALYPDIPYRVIKKSWG